MTSNTLWFYQSRNCTFRCWPRMEPENEQTKSYIGPSIQESPQTNLSCTKYDKLVSWARCHGAIIPETLIFPVEPNGHCRTTVSVVPGTQLFHIPHSILMTPLAARTALLKLRDVPVHELMCTFIALERRKDGFWKDYLDSLPQEFTTPPYFTERELQVLKGTNLSFAWRDRITQWKEEFDHAKSLTNDLKWCLSLKLIWF